MLLCHWEYLGVSVECRTRIPSWSNPRADWIDALAFSWTWELLGVPATILRAPTTSLGAPRMTIGQAVRSSIFFGNTVGSTGYYSYYISFNDLWNSCIQFVFSLMYLCIYLATNQQTVYLACRQAVLESKSSYAWKWRSRKLRYTLRGGYCVNLEMDMESVIERV